MNFYRTGAEALAALGASVRPELAGVEERYPFFSSRYYLDLIDPADPADPIARQLLPASEELADEESSLDPLAEREQMAAPKLIRRFVDRAVLVSTGKCAAHCRFCFRKRGWTRGMEHTDLTREELAEVVSYLAAHPEIREVLISGGDPLMLPFDWLREIVETLAGLESIDILRIGSRMPVVWPERVTAELAAFLGETPGVWFATHFNHPREVTGEAAAACARLVKAGVPVINQTVLLKGVNDDAGVLEELFRRLVALRVKPHYLFHVDPVRGVRHFATGIDKGLEILRAFRPRLSSLAVPTFAIDLPEGGGKVALQPDYEKDGAYPDIGSGKMISYYASTSLWSKDRKD